MVIPPLRRKVFRDLRRLWPQVFAIALVLAAGVATLILGTGAVSSLSETRARYYEANRFADVFTDVTRAPRALMAEIAEIDGVLAAEARIVKLGLLDTPDMAEPGSVLFVSQSGTENSGLNRLYLRQGRFADPQSTKEVVVSEDFARAHRLSPGATVSVLLNGQKRELVVTGVALSPEFIYTLGPGQMMPDPLHFGVIWTPQASLEAAFDLEGAFSNVVLKLAPGASESRVIEALDRLTARYGGVGATGRAEQISHAFLDAELTQLNAMVKILPPIFLLVAAMLVNMTLSRLIALEREQIGLLKAIGYSSRAIALHYIEFVLLICAAGILIGFVAGAWLGVGLAELYAKFFSFPFLVFTRNPQIYAVGALVTAAAAVAGALYAVRAVLVLAPAVAMAPPAPTVYSRRMQAVGRMLVLRQTEVMVARHLFRWPFRTVTSVFGVAMSVAVLVASMWTSGSINHMIDVTYFRSERQDAIVAFGTAEPIAALYNAQHMPGVIAAEPFRTVTARISNRNLSKRVTVTGKPSSPRLSRLLDPGFRAMQIPDAGIILSEALSEALGVRPGETVTVAFLEGARPEINLPVSGISLGYVGLSAVMGLEALNRTMREDRMISGVNLQLDPIGRAAFFSAAKSAPKTNFVTVTSLTIDRFRETLAENILVMNTVFVTLATIIAVGVVYNFARVSLSEQGRELASLRVLGFTRAEVAGVLFRELGLVVLLAQPIGWLLGYGMAAAMVAAFSSDLYRVPFVIMPDVYATASLIVLAAAIASGLAIWKRINNLDMIEVLKTRE